MPPSGAIRVDPDQLLAAVAEIGAAVTGLGAARGVLADVDARLQDPAVLEQRGDADHKIGTFVRQWREEFELIGGLLAHVDEALVAAAQVYAETDRGFADELARCTPG